MLLAWRKDCGYSADDDWVFASAVSHGKNPIWFDTLLQKYIQPAARDSGIAKKIGWHTFRHSLATLLADKGEKVKVVQELLRHSNSRITQDLYQQANADSKRLAQTHVATLFDAKAA